MYAIRSYYALNASITRAYLVHLGQIDPGPLHKKTGIEKAGRNGYAADDPADHGWQNLH